MLGKGSCIIIQYEGTFFALTANHALNDLKDKNGNYQNESPFWISVKHRAKWESMFDFFMPKKFGLLVN